MIFFCQCKDLAVQSSFDDQWTHVLQKFQSRAITVIFQGFAIKWKPNDCLKNNYVSHLQTHDWHKSETLILYIKTYTTWNSTGKVNFAVCLYFYYVKTQFTNSSLSSVVSLLPTDQEVSGSISGYAVLFFSYIELFHKMYGVVFQCILSMFRHVLCSEDFFHSDNHKSEEALQLCKCSYLWSIETIKPRSHGKGYEREVKLRGRKKNHFTLYCTCEFNWESKVDHKRLILLF